MRDILFKGKRVDNGEWVYGYYFKATHHWHNHGIHEDWIATDTVQNGGWCNVRGKYAVLPETVGQYTGLTDKNGKKIFEGDIIRVLGKYIDVVVFYKGCFCMDRQLYNYEFTFQSSEQLEAIGNIHDNPELIEVK